MTIRPVNISEHSSLNFCHLCRLQRRHVHPEIEHQVGTLTQRHTVTHLHTHTLTYPHFILPHPSMFAFTDSCLSCIEPLAPNDSESSICLRFLPERRPIRNVRVYDVMSSNTLGLDP